MKINKVVYMDTKTNDIFIWDGDVVEYNELPYATPHEGQVTINVLLKHMEIVRIGLF